jgi:hypothetical protein
MVRPKILMDEETDTKSYVVFETDFFHIRWPIKQMDSFAKKIQKNVNDRKEYVSAIYQEVLKRMRFKIEKGAGLDINKIGRAHV